jgi:hypothetical protein
MLQQPPAFIDVEASGLGSASYPIEVGLAIPQPMAWGGWEVVLLSALITPVPEWHGQSDHP